MQQTQTQIQLCYIAKKDGDRTLYWNGSQWVGSKEDCPLYTNDGTLLNRWGGTCETPHLEAVEVEQ